MRRPMRVCLNCQTRFDQPGWTCPACGHAPAERGGFITFAPSADDERTGFDADLFQTLFQVEPGHFWFRARNRMLVHLLQTHFPQAQSFFEIGCGTGYVLEAMGRARPGIQLAGTDLFVEALSYCQQRVPQADVFQMDARIIPFEDHFDVVGIFDVLEHIAEDQRVLRQLRQAVRPGGGVLISVPQHPFLWSSFDTYSHHVRRYTRAELVSKVEQAGFTVERVLSFNAALFPAMLASRLVKRESRDIRQDLIAELKISGATNRLLERLLDVEYTWLRRGLSTPFGGSLMLAARAPLETAPEAAPVARGSAVSSTAA